MSKILYRDAKRGDITSGSYSARREFKFCKRLFKLGRIDGWSEKTLRGSAEYGKCIEAAVEYHVKNGGKGGDERFIQLWEQVKKIKTFPQWEYTATEVSWEAMLQAGRDHLTLFAIKLPSLPIVSGLKPRFQVRLVKEIFPGTALAGLDNKAYVDILAYPRFDHPMLEKPPEGVVFEGGVRPLIIDVKTSGVTLDTRLVRLDPQLQEYGWQAQVFDVSFLWFLKKAPGMAKGSKVSTLVETNNYPAGWELVVLMLDDETHGVWAGNADVYERFCQSTHDGKGETLKGKKLELAKAQFLAGGAATLYYPGEVTKQQLHFASARLTQEDLNDVGQGVGLVTVEMVQAHETGFYPKEGGIRFPDQKCNNCRMLPICAGDSEARDETLTRHGEEWLDGDSDNA